METKHGVGGMGSDLGTITMSAANALIKMKVYKSLMSDVGVKLVREDGGSEGDVRARNTVINQWEELSFNLCGKVSAITTIDQLVVFPDFNVEPNNHTNNSVSYIDDITFNACPGVVVAPAPTVAATAPTVASGNVISLFSDAYTNVAVNTWRADWSVGTLTDTTVAGSAMKKYANLDFVGVESKGANSINATAMTFFNVDMWSADSTNFCVKLVDWGNGNAVGGGDDVEHELCNIPTQSGWNTFHLPLSSFTGLTTKAHISQIIFKSVPAGSSTVYLDNVYFNK